MQLPPCSFTLTLFTMLSSLLENGFCLYFKHADTAASLGPPTMQPGEKPLASCDMLQKRCQHAADALHLCRVFGTPTCRSSCCPMCVFPTKQKWTFVVQGTQMHTTEGPVEVAYTL